MSFQRATLVGLGIVLAMAAMPLPVSNASGGVVGCAVTPANPTCTFICPPFPIILSVSALGGSTILTPLPVPGATITGSCGSGGAACTAQVGGVCSSTGATAGTLGICTLTDHLIPDDAFGVCRNLGPAPLSQPGTPDSCPHASPHSHTYGSGGSAGARSDTATGGDEVGAGIVTVTDTNTGDCDNDGVAGDFDGDYDSGVGGGFFGFGPWADEGVCNYGLELHGAVVTVNDAAFGSDIWFVIGADDTSGPVITPVIDPPTGQPTGEFTCETDGSITPGDPATDPTADADDCLTQPLNGSGSTCGAGGDGGYWVFLSGALVSEGAGGVGANNAPTAGTITA